ncbi:unnamed protein product [Linum trigynum]|uniref:Annexin n=1 Tax=Linum trigynum TaxID=586398 RepID=A0AAV2G0X7_9ROSI
MVDITGKSSEAIKRRYGGTLDAGRLRGMLHDANNASKHELSRLAKVEVKRLKGTKHETAFLEWLFSSSHALESMEIQLEGKLSAAEKVLILTELTGFRRASTRARIIVK